MEIIINQKITDNVFGSVWLGALVLTYYNQEILNNDIVAFGQSEIVKIAEKFSVKKVHPARVQQWCNGDDPNSSYNYLREKGKKRRLTRIGEFSNHREFPVDFLNENIWIIKTLPDDKEIKFFDLMFWYRTTYSKKEDLVIKSMDQNNFQRIGSTSNAHAGREFESLANQYLRNTLKVKNCYQSYQVEIGFGKYKKNHAFDFGGYLENNNKFVMECKSHTWTAGKNVPSAKLTVWNEVMLFFSLVPDETIKYLFVLKDYSEKRKETLAEYYVRMNRHLIPQSVIIIEYDVNNNVAVEVYNNF